MAAVPVSGAIPAALCGRDVLGLRGGERLGLTRRICPPIAVRSAGDVRHGSRRRRRASALVVGRKFRFEEVWHGYVPFSFPFSYRRDRFHGGMPGAGADGDPSCTGALVCIRRRQGISAGPPIVSADVRLCLRRDADLRGGGLRDPVCDATDG